MSHLSIICLWLDKCFHNAEQDIKKLLLSERHPFTAQKSVQLCDILHEILTFPLRYTKLIKF